MNSLIACLLMGDLNGTVDWRSLFLLSFRDVNIAGSFVGFVSIIFRIKLTIYSC